MLDMTAFLYGLGGILATGFVTWAISLAWCSKPATTGNWLVSKRILGNALIWWGFYLLALSAGGWWTVVSPLLMTFLLLKVSGVVLLEQDISDRRPAYRAYIQRTNAFFPGPPRAAEPANHPREVRL